MRKTAHRSFSFLLVKITRLHLSLQFRQSTYNVGLVQDRACLRNCLQNFTFSYCIPVGQFLQENIGLDINEAWFLAIFFKSTRHMEVHGLSNKFVNSYDLHIQNNHPRRVNSFILSSSSIFLLWSQIGLFRSVISLCLSGI